MTLFLAFSMPGGPELILIFLLVLILFGAKKLPELARGLGQAANEFRKAKDEFNRELETSDPARVTPRPAPEVQPYNLAQPAIQPAAQPAPAPVPVPASQPVAAPVAAPAAANPPH